MPGNLTRILNNQITNSTIIASQKIANGTITGSLFSSNITVPGDLLIAGNLFVLGTSAYTTIASTNTYVNDPLITLNNGFAGTNTYDEGLVFNRGSLQNRALIWSEYFQEFRLIGTTEAGTTYGNVVTSNFANLHIGNLIVDYTINHTGNFFTNGFINTTANISAVVGLFGAINSTGLINTTGNVSASQVSVATLNATGLINTLGNVSANTVSAYALSGIITTASQTNITAVGTLGSLNVTGNVLAASLVGGAVNVSGNVTANNINAYSLGGIITTASQTNITAVGTLGSLNVTGNILASGAVVNALTVNGNESVTGYLNVTGNVLGSAGTLNTLNINSTTNATGQSTGALQVAGGASFTQDVWIGGNLFVSNIIGVTANVITVQDPLLYLRNSNISAYNYDIGFYSAFTGTGLGTLNQYQHTAVFRDPLDNTWKFASNLAEPTASYITLDGSTVYDPIKAGNLNLVNTTASTTTGTGALIVAGGAGIAGAVTAGSFNTAGNVLATGGIFNALTVNGTTTLTGFLNSSANISAAIINAGAINSTGFINTSGNISAAVSIAGSYNTTGNILATGAVLNALTVNGTGTFTVLAATGNIIAGLAQFAAINSTPIGNASASTGAFTTLSASGVASITNSTDTSSLSTGALIVTGGTAVGKTLWVGEGAVINSTRAAEAFQVYGATGNNGLIYADTAKSAIVFSDTGNTTVQNGVITKFDSDGAIILPVGSSARRPSGAGNVDVIGMIRFNNTISNMEFYDGAAWQTAGSTFTVISDRQFSGNLGGGYGNVDGTNTTFTLQANSTTAGTIVSINGVLQFPTLAYSVSGTTMTFTEPPAPNDVISARILTTTSTVTSIASANGYNQFVVDNTSASIYTGTSSSIQRLSVGTDGQINLLTGNEITYDQTATQVVNTNLTLLDSFSANAFTTAKYIISMKQGTGNVQAMEALVTQSTVGSTAGTAYITTYGIVNTGNTMGSLAANVDVSGSWTVKMWLIPNAATAISNVKVMTTYIV